MLIMFVYYYYNDYCYYNNAGFTLLFIIFGCLCWYFQFIIRVSLHIFNSSFYQLLYNLL